MVKKRVALLTAAMLLLSAMVPCLAVTSVSDCEGHWAEDIILKWLNSGMANGYSDGTFRPEKEVRRAEFIVMVNNAFGFVNTKDIFFTDVSRSAWYYDDVCKAVAAGYIEGTPEGLFMPDSELTRQEAAIIISRIKNLKEDADYAKNFADSDTIKDFACGYVGAVVKAGYMRGDDRNMFKPLQPVTRAEALVTVDHAAFGDDGGDSPVVGDETLKGGGSSGGGNSGGGGYKTVTVAGLHIKAASPSAVYAVPERGKEPLKLSFDAEVIYAVNGIVDESRTDNNVLWSMAVPAEMPEGAVFIDLKTGLVTVSSTAVAAESVTVKASSVVDEYIYAQYEFALAKQEPYLYISGEGFMGIPSTFTYEAAVRTATGSAITGSAVKWTLTADDETGIESHVWPDDGCKITVEAGVTSRPQVITLMAEWENIEVVKKIEIIQRIDDNVFVMDSASQFAEGTFAGTAWDEGIGDDGAIVLAKNTGDGFGSYRSEGEYLSEVIPVKDFEYLVASWNSDTPEGTYVEVWVKALVNHSDENGKGVESWCDWMSWGRWSPFDDGRRCANTEDELAYVDADVMTIKGSDSETASQIQFKVVLTSEDPTRTPSVRLLAATYKMGGEDIVKKLPSDADIYGNMDLDVPAYSQVIRYPGTAMSICSPTTTSMLLNYRGEKLLPDELAQNTYAGNKGGFGDWSFNMATAGSYGYQAWVEYTSLDGLRYEISQGNPVGVSVRYSDKSDDTLPYIEGAPGRTPGHLIVVRGFETGSDGIEYVIVNDSYFNTDEEAGGVRYRLDQFERAWSNRVAYIVHEKEKNIPSDGHIMRIAAELESAGSDVYRVSYRTDQGMVNLDLSGFPGVFAVTADDVTFAYPDRSCGSEDGLQINDEIISSLLPEGYSQDSIVLKVYIIFDSGKVYVANYRFIVPE